MYLETYSADLGNRRLKTIDLSGNVIKRASAIKWLKGYEDDIKGSEASPVVTILEGGKPKTYVVGAAAQARGGQANLHATDKVAQSKYFLLATLPQHPELDIKLLRLAVPDARSSEHKTILSELVGTHHYVRNGQKQSVTIRNIKLVDEVKGAYLYGCNNQLFGLPQQLNAVWSAGGGDFCASIVNDGTILREHDLVIKRGTAALANAIAAEKKSQLKSNLNPIEIMDAIESGTYATYSGIDFSDVFDSCLKQWIEEITGEIKLAWREQLPNIRQTLIVGGSAPLFAVYREGLKHKIKCVIAPKPQEAIVLGLRYA